MRHVHDVVDHLAAVRAFHQDRVPGPVGPVGGVGAVDPRDRHVVRRRVSLRVVPDEELPVPFQGEPGPGAGGRRHPPRVGDRRAPAVAAPAPVMERAGDLVALDRARGQVAAHVPAVRVEHVQLAGGVGEDDQLGAERLHGVRPRRVAVAEHLRQPKAVPAAREPGRRRPDVDSPRPIHTHRLEHVLVLWRWAITRKAQLVGESGAYTGPEPAVVAAVADLLPVFRQRAQETEDNRVVSAESVKALAGDRASSGCSSRPATAGLRRTRSRSSPRCG